MLRSPCLGMPRRVSPHPSMWGIPDVSLPDLLWRRSLPCLPKEPAGEVCAIQTYGSSKVCAMRTIALLVTPVLHPPCILQGLKCMPGRTALLQSRAELGEVGGCAAQGCTGSTRRRNAGDCLFCLSTAPAMTYCRGGPAQLINCVLLTREAAQQEVKPQSRIPTSRETITWGWEQSHREHVGISSNIWASLTETVGTWISLRLVGILGVDGFFGFTYSFAFAFLLPVLFLILILWWFSLSSV